jgi:ribonuclease VapC
LPIAEKKRRRTVANKVVLDASAFLAVANREPGADRVYARLKDSIMSAVNAAEVLQKLADKGMSHRKAGEYLRQFVPEIADFDYPQAVLVAAMVAKTLPLGLSFADRACLALASLRGVSVLTGDKVWAQVDLGIHIEVIRPATSSV